MTGGRTRELDELPAKEQEVRGRRQTGDPDHQVRRAGRGDQRRRARRADAMSADSPVTAGRSSRPTANWRPPVRSSTRRPTAGRSEKRLALAQSLQKALEHLITTGDYKTIAGKWGLESGLIEKPVINRAIN